MKIVIAALAVIATAWGPARGARQEASIAPQPTSIEGARTHVYKSIDGIDLRLHVFTPHDHLASMKSPAIVFFFGGGWTQGTVEQFVPQSQHLAAGGMVAIVADYRVFGRHKTTPFDAITDAKSAIRWVRSHARQLGIDPARIAAGGGSSGGHIALSAAVFDRFDDPREDKSINSKPNALVLFNPAVDTSAAPTFAARTPGREQEGSPFHHLDRTLPPTVILHGTADATVPYASVERFCARAKELGRRCEVVGYEGAGHGFFNPPNARGKWDRQTVLEMDLFLASIGYLSKSVAE